MRLIKEKKLYYKEYYKKHKEKMLESQKKWRENNKDKFYQSVYKVRKRKAERLKSEGVKFNWLSDKARKIRNEGKNEQTRKNDEC